MQVQPRDLDLLKMKWSRPFASLNKPYLPCDLNQIMVVWNGRMRSRAGVCKPAELLIELNPNILRSIPDLEQTFIHELCHMAVSLRWPYAQSHGLKWRGLMTQLGFKPERCHDLTIGRRHVQRRWQAACTCRTHAISTRVFNRMKRGVRYKCIDCNDMLTTQGRAAGNAEI
jgi:predicted SprT family Zn-dependent metalloprotease